MFALFLTKCLATIIVSVLALVAVVYAGSLTPLASPAASGYTLGDIYTRLTTNTAAGSHSFSPGSSPASSLHSLSEIYGAIPAIDAAKLIRGTTYLGVAGTYDTTNLSAANVKSGAAFGAASTGALLPFGGSALPGDVAAGKTFFGANQGDWNLQTGTLDTSATSTADWLYGGNDATQVLTTAAAPGSYSAVNLIPDNVRSGIVFGFNQIGTLDVSATSTYAYGDNDAANVLTVAAGHGTFDATNLIAGSVKNGTTFGVGLTGQYPSASYPLPGGAGFTDIVAGDLPGGREAWTKSGTLVTGNMTVGNDVNGANGVLHFSIPSGYYSGKYATASDSNLLQENIKSGVSIFGVTGNYSGPAGYTYGSNTSSGVLTTAIGSPGTFNVANLANNLIKSGTAWGDSLGQTGTLLPNGGTATAGDVCNSKTFFGAAQADWNLNTGALTIDPAKMLTTATYCGTQGTIATQTLSSANDTVAAGYYAATTLHAVDSNLASGNIKGGVSIFGIAGSSKVMDTATGTAAAGDILSGKIAFANGSTITGSVTAGSSVSGTNGQLVISIPNGLYSGGANTATASDTNLLSANIKSGVSIFGVSGNSNVVDTTAGTAAAGDIL